MDDERDFIKKWRVDINRTLLANIPFFFFGLLVMVFIIITTRYASSIIDPVLQSIFMIVFVFGVLKLVAMIGSPTLHYEPRIKGGKAK